MLSLARQRLLGGIMKYLFTGSSIDQYSFLEKDRIIFSFFNIVYDDGNFLKTIELICNNIGYDVNGVGYSFPEMDSFYEELHFEGVCFNRLGDEIYVSDEDFKKYVEIACKVYLEKHPKDTSAIRKYMSQFCLLSNGTDDILKKYQKDIR